MNTRDKRSSAIDCLWHPMYPIPDGNTLTQADRQHVSGIYSGIDFTKNYLFQKLFFTSIDIIALGFTYLSSRSIKVFSLFVKNISANEIVQKEDSFSGIDKLTTSMESLEQHEDSHTLIDRSGVDSSATELLGDSHSDIDSVEVGNTALEQKEDGFTDIENISDDFTEII